MRPSTSLKFARIDFNIQVFAMSFNTLLILLGVFNQQTIVLLFIFQFLLGTYQLLISGMINYITSQHNKSLKSIRLIYIITSVAYILSFYTIGDRLDFWGNKSEIILIAVIPQLFAYTYFALSYFDLKSREKKYSQSSFWMPM